MKNKNMLMVAFLSFYGCTGSLQPNTTNQSNKLESKVEDVSIVGKTIYHHLRDETYYKIGKNYLRRYFVTKTKKPLTGIIEYTNGAGAITGRRDVVNGYSTYLVTYEKCNRLILSSMQEFKNGLEDGLYKKYRISCKNNRLQSKRLHVEGSYKNGRKDGVFTYYNLKKGTTKTAICVQGNCKTRR